MWKMTVTFKNDYVESYSTTTDSAAAIAKALMKNDQAVTSIHIERV